VEINSLESLTNINQMEPKKIFKAFLSDLRSASNLEFSSFKDSDVEAFESWCIPNALKILQKDSTLFDTSVVMFGVDLKQIYAANTDMIWKHIQLCTIAIFLNGDIKEKFGSILETVKSFWGDSGHSTDEIDKLIGNEETKGKISELIEFVMSTRIAKVVNSLVETLDISELGLDFENPEDLLKMFQNVQNNPVVEKIMKKIQRILEDKVRRGEFTKEMLVQDVEAIKVKVQGAFGDMFNDMLGGRQAEVPAKVLLSNSPEARRARMVARLQRKVQERKTPQ